MAADAFCYLGCCRDGGGNLIGRGTRKKMGERFQHHLNCWRERKKKEKQLGDDWHVVLNTASIVEYSVQRILSVHV